MHSPQLDPKFIGQNVQQLREQRGWSQKELAQHAHLSQGQVSLIERGEGNPTVESINKLSVALGIAAFILILGATLYMLSEQSQKE